ncbi:MAG TPA: hypothetical protein VMT37_05295 [Solirubrobacterales bacterium]|nr:hypothetical protein [Solirubrobacterales bacterium]
MSGSQRGTIVVDEGTGGLRVAYGPSISQYEPSFTSQRWERVHYPY